MRHALARNARRPLVVGLAGAQGSGKSTLAAALRQRFERTGLGTAILSIDDLYLTRAEREHLARTIHPLLITRGVPGTHDIRLGLEVIGHIEQGRAAALPRFDKARDDRAPEALWDIAPADTELLILEGWCVGARPQSQAALSRPVNRLEREEDRHGVWRRFANQALKGDYQALFARIDLLVLLAAPSFDCVFDWRSQQERALRMAAGPNAPGVMSDEELTRFIQHYERLTRHMLAEMPSRADLLVELERDRSARRILTPRP